MNQMIFPSLSPENLSEENAKNTDFCDPIISPTEDSQVIFDSGTSYIIVPLRDFNLLKINIIDKLKADCRFTTELQLICKCVSKEMFGSIKLILGDNSEFIIKFENIIDYYPFLEYQCRFQLLLDLQYYSSVWIIGDSLLRNMLITFDLKSHSISYVQEINLYSKSIVETAIKTEKQTPLNTVFYLMLIVALIVIFFIIFKCITRFQSGSGRENQGTNNLNANMSDVTQENHEERDYEMMVNDRYNVPGLRNLASDIIRKRSSFYDLRVKDDITISQKDLLYRAHNN